MPISLSRREIHSSQRDPGAPIYVTKSEKEELKRRNDMIQFQRDIEEERDREQRKELISQRNGWFDGLCRLKLEDKREKYFDKADDLRQKHLATDHLRRQGKLQQAGRF